MNRDFTKKLKAWKGHPLRMPLIVRGARQVGKTYVIENFGKNEFKHFIGINFESTSVYKACFEELNAAVIVKAIELTSRQEIIPGETLLFLDEIQQCPKALQALRYFKEQMPDLHVIAAGSLLEFAMQEELFSFPVGRVQFAQLYPFSFCEFLDACGDAALRQEMAHLQVEKPPSAALHERLLQRVREYFVIGGMPAAIQAFLTTNSFLEVKYVQKALWDTYENDFGKYAPKAQHRHLKKVFQEAAKLIGTHVKYSRIDPELPNPAREIKRAIELLEMAGLLHPIFASHGSFPLLAGVKESIFKALFLDIGLIEQIMNLDLNHPGLMAGPLAEQFVGQEILANSDPLLQEKLFFWSRESGAAEVDYLIQQNGSIFPVEVKAGKWGKLKSLQLFLKEKKAPFGIKISPEPLGWEKNILSVPLYLISELRRLYRM